MTVETSLTLAPTSDPRTFRDERGALYSPPAGWVLVPPGDPGLTRRIKAAGPSWSVQERRGRKLFSRGVWAPAGNVREAELALERERATPEYARRREGDARRREEAQARYVDDFRAAVLAFLDFSPAYAARARVFAEAVSAHATPVGSGTVARTERIPLEERAEAAVIAWMRHQTTAYDDLDIARVRGERRRVRAALAERSRKVLAAHRTEQLHPSSECVLCAALGALVRASRPLAAASER